MSDTGTQKPLTARTKHISDAQGEPDSPEQRDIMTDQANIEEYLVELRIYHAQLIFMNNERSLVSISCPDSTGR